MTEEENDIELAQKINKIIHYDFRDDIKNDIFIILDKLVKATELKGLSATQTLIKNQYYRIQDEKEKHLESIIKKQQEEIEELQELKMSVSAVNRIDNLQKEVNEENKRCAELAIENQDLKEQLKKKDKIINEIVKAFKQDDIRNVEEIKQYFLKKVEDK